MIPTAHVTAWRGAAPWATDAQVEQDLVLSRALVDLFTSEELAASLAFRGGTALHKLFLQPPARYSEDLDLVQVQGGAIGPTLDAVRAVLDPWLGRPKRSSAPASATLVYRFETTSKPVQSMRLKVEINTREHFNVLKLQRRPFAVESPWFSGRAEVVTYAIEELLATKLRALYQRRKGRDLFDLWLALTALRPDEERIVECFARYMRDGGVSVSRAEFEANLKTKLASPAFGGDLIPLLRTGVTYDSEDAGAVVLEGLVARLPGDPWKGGVSRGRKGT